MRDDGADEIPRAPKTMTIIRAGSAIASGPAGVASGPFWAETLIASAGDGDPTVVRATFEPGAITHWHSHPLGQVLYVLTGVGRVQRAGGPVEEIRSGDCVWFAPGERHWHGASPDSLFGYVSIQAVHEGTAVHWMEPVAMG
ncbi:cupin domain-containing protein [Phreatobacter stygius]|uniref:Cupin domain-containing protein n=1 Tax=Phreatobacter stygius TaxID=1940610 RepID=A0A4D7B5E5_9HYPH|nr:cupin domain-containing protein [Phreatobacter stygius]QCI69069.1 cupin domain-containing protein [Phreatobacter stygius]